MITLKDPGDQNDPLAFFRGVSRVELFWGKCTVFPELGTGDRWLINLHLCATCQYPLNWNWKNCAIAPK